MGIYQGSKLMSGGGGGPSPYEIAKQNGYTGTEQAFNQLLAALDQNATEQDLNNKADLVNGKVPAEQIDAYTKTEADTLLQNKADSMVLQSHIANTENPHGVTAVQTGAIASTEKGSASGVATLGEDALLAAAQRPKAGGLYRDDGTTTVEASLAEISTTLQNKAPNGSGQTLNDAHAFSGPGWYWVAANSPNMPTDMDGRDYNTTNGLLFVEFTGGYDAKIDIWFPNWSTSYVPHFRQEKVYGEWKPWCWVDPSMYIGWEYRTTERYDGKPVYVKLVDFGPLPKNTIKSVPLSKIVDGKTVEMTEARIFRCSGVSSYGVSLGTGELEHDAHLWGNSHRIKMKTDTDQSSYTATVTVWYTKTTD